MGITTTIAMWLSYTTMFIKIGHTDTRTPKVSKIVKYNILLRHGESLSPTKKTSCFREQSKPSSAYTKILLFISLLSQMKK